MIEVDNTTDLHLLPFPRKSITSHQNLRIVKKEFSIRLKFRKSSDFLKKIGKGSRQVFDLFQLESWEIKIGRTLDNFMVKSHHLTPEFQFFSAELLSGLCSNNFSGPELSQDYFALLRTE